MAEKNSARKFSMLALRLICYLALASFAVAWGAVDFMQWLGLFPRQDAINLTCSSEWASYIASTSNAVVVTGIFLGIPFLIGGLLFLVYDVFRLFTRNRA